MNSSELEARAVRALYSVKKKPGRQHSNVPTYKRLLETVAYGLTDCWHWVGPTNGHGYGRFSYKGKPAQAHRVSYETFVGPVLDGLLVLHKCDNRACINPEHLFLGTMSDNRRDCVSKGRWVVKNIKRGADSPCSKVTNETLAQAEALRRSGLSYAKIAERVGVSTMTVWKALNRRD